jgi:hypothetical protein
VLINFAVPVSLEQSSLALGLYVESSFDLKTNRSRQEEWRMKRALLTVLSITLAFVFACQSDEKANKNGNGNSNAPVSSNAAQDVAPLAFQKTEKIVQIFISDAANPGFYTVEEPVTPTVHKLKNQKIVWCIVYDGSATSPTKVIIDNIQFPKVSPTRMNPFGDGSAGDNTFPIVAADFDCKTKTKTAKSDAVLGPYTYRIRVFLGTEVRGSLDPEIIISE